MFCGTGDADRQRRGMKKAIVALARRLAVIMHRISALSFADQGNRSGMSDMLD